MAATSDEGRLAGVERTYAYSAMAKIGFNGGQNEPQPKAQKSRQPGNIPDCRLGV